MASFRREPWLIGLGDTGRCPPTGGSSVRSPSGPPFPRPLDSAERSRTARNRYTREHWLIAGTHGLAKESDAPSGTHGPASRRWILESPPSGVGQPVAYARVEAERHALGEAADGCAGCATARRRPRGVWWRHSDLAHSATCARAGPAEMGKRLRGRRRGFSASGVDSRGRQRGAVA